MNQTVTADALNNYYPDFVKILGEGHPIKNYFAENFFLHRLLRELTAADPTQDFQKFFNLFNQLCEIEKRYARKENQLFPFLEKRGWNGPSQGMWAFHDSIRDLLRGVRKKTEAHALSGLAEDIQLIHSEMQRMMSVEESRLFPIALQLLTEGDWKEMSLGEKEIGWMLPADPATFSSETATSDSAVPNQLRMDEGYMSLEQVNLMLKFMPVDLTYVDENDRVIFYNRGEDRVFPRSAGIIGREVRFCHPPKSVGTVLKILEEFKKGTQNEAAFWIRFKGRVIHIRYFAVRDAYGKYKGVMEMSQDITEIQKIEGEQRLLDWDTQP